MITATKPSRGKPLHSPYVQRTSSSVANPRYFVSRLLPSRHYAKWYLHEIVLWRGLPGPAETFESSHVWGWRFIDMLRHCQRAGTLFLLEYRRQIRLVLGVILSTKQLSESGACAGKKKGNFDPPTSGHGLRSLKNQIY